MVIHMLGRGKIDMVAFLLGKGGEREGREMTTSLRRNAAQLR